MNDNKQKAELISKIRQNKKRGNHHFYQFRREVAPQLLFMLAEHPLALKILAILMYASNEDGAVAIKQKYLRKAVATKGYESNKNSTINAIEYMQKLGVLTVERKDVHNIYILNPEFIWRAKNNPMSRMKIESNVYFENNPIKIRNNGKLAKRFLYARSRSEQTRISDLVKLKKIKQEQNEHIIDEIGNYKYNHKRDGGSRNGISKNARYLTKLTAKDLRNRINGIVGNYNKINKENKIQRRKGIKSYKDRKIRFNIIPLNRKDIVNYIVKYLNKTNQKSETFFMTPRDIIKTLSQISNYWQIVTFDDIDAKFVSIKSIKKHTGKNKGKEYRKASYLKSINRLLKNFC